MSDSDMDSLFDSSDDEADTVSITDLESSRPRYCELVDNLKKEGKNCGLEFAASHVPNTKRIWNALALSKLLINYRNISPPQIHIYQYK
jgi:hypothetical protein